MAMPRPFLDVFELVPEPDVPPLDAPVSSAMRRPVTVAEGTPLSRGAELLLGEGAGLLVVVDERKRPLGVLTPADVVAIVRRVGGPKLDALTVLDAARSGGRFMPETSSVRAARLAMVTEGRDFFLVVAEGGRLAGLITALDVLDALHEEPAPASGLREAGDGMRASGSFSEWKEGAP